MLHTSLCRCFRGTNKADRFDPQKVLGAEFDGSLHDIEETPIQPPQITGLLSYSAAVDQPLRGIPIREGKLWYLSAEEQVEPVNFTLYVNGFSFVHDGHEISISLSPFALVRNCKFQSNYSTLNLSEFKIFKVSLFTQGICYYYGVRGTDENQAEEERSRWVLDISRAIRVVTQSLFPPFFISCDPLEAVASTERRLMAGYLIHHDDLSDISVLYCELHPQADDQARLVLFENELCQTPVMYIFLTERSICCEKVGINCSCFCIEDHQFSSRTLAERKLWLRAISNVKVKLQNKAPSPSKEDLMHYRQAIKEHINTMQSTLESQAPMDALLQRNPRKTYGVQPALESELNGYEAWHGREGARASPGRSDNGTDEAVAASPVTNGAPIVTAEKELPVPREDSNRLELPSSGAS
eukprot:gnl/TRDRNA2_/TRDRNA2_187344_c0_seq1.p1 gnl/TRDRNA2_/TRDRNA2_187344_c0~~gnl/TRDRNA2_/TRDRNA2_187344_c0_seq1.p1  ORF type:complete len:412 (-),score=77.98 gnl/TRDRNA2_/TRDRNA2_187344_c0_seq1:150-1385(-)